MHHSFISHGDDLHDIRVLVGIAHCLLNLAGIVLLTFLTVVWSLRSPSALTINPSPEHNVHFKGRIFLFERLYGLEHIWCVWKL